MSIKSGKTKDITNLREVPYVNKIRQNRIPHKS
jgi:hypothetical protein